MFSRRWLVVLFVFAVLGSAQAPQHPVVPAAAQASAHFDAKAATDAWLASLPNRFRERSDAYFEGTYWLMLWDYLAGMAVALAILQTGLSARMRDLAERVTRVRILQTLLYWAQFALLNAVVTFPLAMYEGFSREHSYGLSNQTFGAWFRDQSVGMALAIVLGGLIIAGLFAVVRRLPRTWHIWGALVTVGFLIVVMTIGPVFITPLFNTSKLLADSPIRTAILNLAHANGIPARDVYQIDASRQSNRVSANVSGFLGTERITLNDNLLRRCSPEAVLSVMGHEMGHYVMHHAETGILFFGVTFALMFAILRYSLDGSLKRWGARWGIRAVDDIAVLPLALVILSTLSFVFTPVSNSFTRAQEYEADLYGINAARQPDGEAEVDLLLGEYRKLDPGPWEEFIFFDHPSGRTRIYAAMRWKAENLCLFDSGLACGAKGK
jgi:STE24 endopeptidase